MKPRAKWRSFRIDAEAFSQGNTGEKKVVYLGNDQWLDVDSVEKYYGQSITEDLLNHIRAVLGVD